MYIKLSFIFKKLLLCQNQGGSAALKEQTAAGVLFTSFDRHQREAVWRFEVLIKVRTAYVLQFFYLLEHKLMIIRPHPCTH